MNRSSVTYGRQLTAEERSLFERILSFDLDDEKSAAPFSYRLADKHGWDKYYTHRCCEEYKKFVFLAITANHPVTPSEVIDEVWHFHLLYTENYWEKFCGETLGRSLHHRPTLGGQVERSRFMLQYEDTISAYKLIFGDPPLDIWPAPKSVATNRDSRWKSNLERLQSGVSGQQFMFLAAVLFVFAAVACNGGGNFGADLSNLIGAPSAEQFLWFFGLASIGVGVGLFVYKRNVNKLLSRENSEHADWDTYLPAHKNFVAIVNFVYLPLISIAAVRMYIGVNRGRPIGYLLVMTLLDVIVWIVLADKWPSGNSGQCSGTHGTGTHGSCGGGGSAGCGG